MLKILAILLCLCSSLLGGDYYIAASGGSDGNPGTEAQPWDTYAYSISQLSGGDTLYFKDGVYSKGQLLINNKNGSSGNRIMLASQNFNQAIIVGPNSGPALLWVKDSSWITISNLHFTNSSAACIWLQGARYCELKKCVARFPDNTANNNTIALLEYSPYGSTKESFSNLVEDCVSLNFHRHGFIDDSSYDPAVENSGASGGFNIFRRNYSNDMGRRHATYTTSRMSEGISSYGSSDNIYENNYMHTNFNVGLALHGTDHGPRHKVYGNIIRDVYELGLFNSRKTSGLAYLTNIHIFNNVFIRGNIGVTTWHGTDNYMSNCVSVGSSSSYGFITDQEDHFYQKYVNYLGTNYEVAHSSTWDAALQTKNMSMNFVNCISINNRYGFFMDYYAAHNKSVRIPPITGPYYSVPASNEYRGYYTTRVENCVAYNNSIGNTYVYPSTNLIVTITNLSTANPNYDTAKYGDGAYLLPPPNASGRGAEIIYQYQDGVLTTNALWPWPMESTIYALTGISPTWSTNGGLWKTLDDVYDLPPTATPLQVSVTAEKPYAYETPNIPARFVFTRSTTTNAIDVYFTVTGTATPATHYTTLPAYVSFGVGVATVYTTVTIIAVSDIRTVIVTLDADPLDPDTYEVAGGSATISLIPSAQTGGLYRPPPGQRAFKSGF